MLDKKDRIFLNDGQVDNVIVNSRIDEKDKLIISMLYDGLMLDNILKLKITDIDFENNTLKSNKEVIKFSKNTMDILKQILIEKSNDILEEKGFKKTIVLDNYENVEGDTYKQKYLEVSAHIITNRIKKIAEIIKEPYLTVNNLWVSGIVNRTSNLA